MRVCPGAHIRIHHLYFSAERIICDCGLIVCIVNGSEHVSRIIVRIFRSVERGAGRNTDVIRIPCSSPLGVQIEAAICKYSDLSLSIPVPVADDRDLACRTKSVAGHLCLISRGTAAWPYACILEYPIVIKIPCTISEYTYLELTISTAIPVARDRDIPCLTKSNGPIDICVPLAVTIVIQIKDTICKYADLDR